MSRRPAGLQPARNRIAIEDIKGKYANLLAVRTQDRNQRWVKKVLAAY